MTEQAKKAINDSAVLRWSVLALASLAMMTNYYFYDALSPLKEALTQNLGFSSSDYGFFVSAYSIPNVFFGMAVIGGIICDKLGIRITGVMFFGSMVVGSCITYYGATDAFNNGGFGYGFMNSFLPSYSPALKMMSFGFLLFGLGAETSCVVISKAVVKWFKGKELALALGLNVSFGRLGTGAAMAISPQLMHPEWQRPIAFGALLLGIGLLLFLFYTVFDRKFDRSMGSDGLESEDPFRFSDVLRLLTNPSYLFVALLCVTFYSAVFPFLKYAPDLLVNKFGMDLETAGQITMMMPFGTILLTPLFGFILDNKGKGASLMVLGSSLLIVVHVLFSLTAITPWIPMLLLGVAFSLVPAAMWPSLAKIVDQNRLGTAYGLTFSIQNIGLWSLPMLIGAVLDKTNPGVAEAKKHAADALDAAKAGFESAAAGSAKEVAQAAVEKAQAALDAVAYDYKYSILMLAVLGVLGLVFSFALKAADKRQGYGLELPNKKDA